MSENSTENPKAVPKRLIDCLLTKEQQQTDMYHVVLSAEQKRQGALLLRSNVSLSGLSWANIMELEAETALAKERKPRQKRPDKRTRRRV